jgi:hypothetical protein
VGKGVIKSAGKNEKEDRERRRVAMTTWNLKNEGYIGATTVGAAGPMQIIKKAFPGENVELFGGVLVEGDTTATGTEVNYGTAKSPLGVGFDGKEPDSGGPGCLNSFSASISAASAAVRLPCGGAAA